ncbi:MAG: hypothetical protein HZB16_19855 [Armatimonadetes bacterium]|nr:hypothetical protein [Armatimonadota bacterium]
MRTRFGLGLLALLAAALFGGCGSGDLGYLYDFFGNGTSPGGGGGATPVNGALVGTVFQRTVHAPSGDYVQVEVRDNGAVANADRTAVVGATVAIVALNKSTTTNALGRYLLGGIPAGDHDLTITLPTPPGGPAGASATFKVRVVAGQVVQGIPAASAR